MKRTKTGRRVAMVLMASMGVFGTTGTFVSSVIGVVTSECRDCFRGCRNPVNPEGGLPPQNNPGTCKVQKDGGKEIDHQLPVPPPGVEVFAFCVCQFLGGAPPHPQLTGDGTSYTMTWNRDKISKYTYWDTTQWSYYTGNPTYYYDSDYAEPAIYGSDGTVWDFGIEVDGNNVFGIPVMVTRGDDIAFITWGAGFDAQGNVVEADPASAAVVLRVESEGWRYQFNRDDDGLSDVTLSFWDTSLNPDGWTPYRRLTINRNGTGSDLGSDGTPKKSVLEENVGGNWVVLEEKHYAHYTEGTHEGKLKHVINNAGKMKADNYDPEDDDDFAFFDDYADESYEWSAGKVSAVTLGGTNGGGCCGQ